MYMLESNPDVGQIANWPAKSRIDWRPSQIAICPVNSRFDWDVSQFAIWLDRDVGQIANWLQNKFSQTPKLSCSYATAVYDRTNHCYYRLLMKAPKIQAHNWSVN